MTLFDDHIERVLSGLNECEKRKLASLGYTFQPEVWHAKVKKKWIAIDCGSSGAFLIEASTGELYNIKSSYGVPDHNKKQKADIGNIQTVDPRVLHQKRYNYLR